jgi:hypothetical protein
MMKSCVIAAALWVASTFAYGLDVPYQAALELRPLSIFNASFEHSLGAEFAAEIGYYSGNFLSLAVGKSFGTATTEDQQKSDIVGETWSVGLRTYSYYRTDSLYLGASVAGTSIELTRANTNDPWLTESYRQAQLESGFRWLWPTGVMLRTGAVLRRLVSGPHVATHTSDSKMSLMRQEVGRMAREEFDFAISRTELSFDLGLGVVF